MQYSLTFLILLSRDDPVRANYAHEVSVFDPVIKCTASPELLWSCAFVVTLTGQCDFGSSALGISTSLLCGFSNAHCSDYRTALRSQGGSEPLTWRIWKLRMDFFTSPPSASATCCGDEIAWWGTRNLLLCPRFFTQHIPKNPAKRKTLTTKRTAKTPSIALK